MLTQLNLGDSNVLAGKSAENFPFAILILVHIKGSSRGSASKGVDGLLDVHLG